MNIISFNNLCKNVCGLCILYLIIETLLVECIRNDISLRCTMSTMMCIILWYTEYAGIAPGFKVSDGALGVKLTLGYVGTSMI